MWHVKEFITKYAVATLASGLYFKTEKASDKRERILY